MAAVALLLAWCPSMFIAAPMSGSLDACTEDTVPWTEVRSLILQYLAGQLPHAALSELEPLVINRLFDRSMSDCWYGCFFVRFFAPVLLGEDNRRRALATNEFHNEWEAWLGSPWSDMLHSPWDVEAVLAAASSTVVDSGIGDDIWGAEMRLCTPDEISFREKVLSEMKHARSKPSDDLAMLSAKRVLLLPEEMFANGGGDLFDFVWEGRLCGAHAAATAALVLGLAGDDGFRVTPGYAYRLAQKIMITTCNTGLLPFLSSPWPIAALLYNLKARIVREEAGKNEAADEDDIALEVVRASAAELGRACAHVP